MYFWKYLHYTGSVASRLHATLLQSRGRENVIQKKKMLNWRTTVSKTILCILFMWVCVSRAASIWWAFASLVARRVFLIIYFTVMLCWLRQIYFLLLLIPVSLTEMHMFYSASDLSCWQSPFKCFYRGKIHSVLDSAASIYRKYRNINSISIYRIVSYRRRKYRNFLYIGINQIFDVSSCRIFIYSMLTFVIRDLLWRLGRSS